mmetsp:Transcript_27759/g.39023  ORF Transcript_27759/g.39023 Transcript_27759/m.39023 type:complete len:531 (+) Transcript_27759:153-1745(+)
MQRIMTFVGTRNVKSINNNVIASSSVTSSSSTGSKGTKAAIFYNSNTSPANINAKPRNGAKLYSTVVDPEGSKRGIDAVKLLPTYLADARACPEGSLQLGIAENQMLEDLLVPALSNFATISSSGSAFAAEYIYYQPTHGRPQIRQAMANYLQRTLKLPKSLDEDGLVLGAGCNAVLENLCFCIAEQGDALLIPTPYYAAFEFDTVARAGLSIVPVTTFASNSDVVPPVDSLESIPAEAYYPNRQSLDAAYDRAKENGNPPRILLLSHPNNPLGICYPADVIQECIDWCRERQVHLISDEIYAGSVYSKSPTNPFTSALTLGSGYEESNNNKKKGLGLGNYIHFVYALSKDFALSGLRVGACYSENEKIRLPMQKLNDLCQISSQTQSLVETMLNAESSSSSFSYWTDEFLQESHLRLRQRSDAIMSVLDECNIPYLPADSGLFVWMDMTKFLPPLDPAMISSDGKENLESQKSRERELYMELMHKGGCLFTPGLSMRNERPGFFRCVFTAASDEEFNLALERLGKFAKK